MNVKSKSLVRWLVLGASVSTFAMTAASTRAHGGHDPEPCHGRNSPSENCCVYGNTAFAQSGTVTCEATDSGGFFTRGNARARFNSGVEARITTQGGSGAVVGEVACQGPRGFYTAYTNYTANLNQREFWHCLVDAGEVRMGYRCHIEAPCEYP